jgi:hypothetical protein
MPMRQMTVNDIASKYPTFSEAALISLKAKGYRFFIWNDERAEMEPVLAKSWDTMLSFVKDFGKGAAAAIIV